MSAVEEIRIKLETRLHEVEAEIESLRAGMSALEAQAAAQAAEAPPPAKPRRPRAAGSTNGHRRAPRGPSRAELEEMLIQAGGPEALELARATGADYGVVLARIRELEQAGRPRG